MVDNLKLVKLDSGKRDRGLLQKLSVPSGYPTELNLVVWILFDYCEDLSLFQNERTHELELKSRSNTFSPQELLAWKRLLQEKRLWGFWKHIFKFYFDPTFVFKFVNECIVESYHLVATEEVVFEKTYIENARNKYSEIAEACYLLRKNLGEIPNADIDLQEDIEEFIAESELPKLLLKLLSKTTACKWPKKEYEFLCLGNGESFSEADDAKNDETYSVYYFPRRKKVNGDEIDPDSKWIKVAYRTNAKDIFGEGLPNKRSNINDLTGGRGMCYRALHDCPPTFEPPPIYDSSTWALGGRTKDTKFLRLVVMSLDNFSEKWGLEFESFGKKKSMGTAIWLPVDCWVQLYSTFFRVPSSGIQDCTKGDYSKIKKIVIPERNCHIKHKL